MSTVPRETVVPAPPVLQYLCHVREGPLKRVPDGRQKLVALQLLLRQRRIPIPIVQDAAPDTLPLELLLPLSAGVTLVGIDLALGARSSSNSSLS